MKKIITFLTIICLMVVSASCEGANTPADAQTSAIPSDVKTVYGEITEVTGNMLNIKLAKMPEGRIFGGDGNGRPARGEMDPEMQEVMDNLKEGESTEITMPDGSTRTVTKGAEGQGNRVMIGNGSAPDGSIADGGPTMQDGSGDNMIITRDGQTMSGNRSSNGEFTMTLEYTGEEKEFIIPVGIPVMKQSMGENGMEETEVALDKIKAGNIITIIYKADGTTIDKILLSPAVAAKAEQ